MAKQSMADVVDDAIDAYEDGELEMPDVHKDKYPPEPDEASPEPAEERPPSESKRPSSKSSRPPSRPLSKRGDSAARRSSSTAERPRRRTTDPPRDEPLDPEEERKKEEEEMAERHEIAREAMQQHVDQIKRIRVALIRRHNEAVRDSQRTQAKLSDQAVERLDRGERQIYRQAMLMAEAQQEGEHVMAQTYRKRMDGAYTEALADCGADLIFDIGQLQNLGLDVQGRKELPKPGEQKNLASRLKMPDPPKSQLELEKERREEYKKRNDPFYHRKKYSGGMTAAEESAARRPPSRDYPEVSTLRHPPIMPHNYQPYIPPS